MLTISTISAGYMFCYSLYVATSDRHYVPV